MKEAWRIYNNNNDSPSVKDELAKPKLIIESNEASFKLLSEGPSVLAMKSLEESDFLPGYCNIIHFAEQLVCFYVVSRVAGPISPFSTLSLWAYANRRTLRNTQSGSFSTLSVKVFARSSIVPTLMPMNSKFG